MGWGKDVISSVQTQHWDLDRRQLVDRTGIMIVVIITRITEHNGGEPFVKLSNGLCLEGCSKTIKLYQLFEIKSKWLKSMKMNLYLHDMINVVTLFKNRSVSARKIINETVTTCCEVSI